VCFRKRCRVSSAWKAAACLAAGVLGVGPDVSQADGLMGGGPLPEVVSPSPDPAFREEMARAVADSLRRFGLESQATSFGVSEKFTFYPLGGTLYGDLFTNNFVDLDPTSGILDWDCTDFTYDGHDATDVNLRSFGEQIIGVPIFAALDGAVGVVSDGNADMNTSCTGQANYVILTHADGRRTSYFHMRKGSVQVSRGQNVRAGEQLGLAASSGCSTWPHLHFATYDSGVLVEPYAGSCRPGDSEWVNQTPIRRDLYVWDLNVTDVNIGGYPGLPFDMPRTGTFVQGTRSVYLWSLLVNQPTSSTWRIRFRRPDGAIAFDTGTGSFGNPFHRWSWWWWVWTLNLNQTGTWNILFEIDGSVLVVVPFDVVASAGQIVNRPPNPISVGIEPANPSEEDVLVCRVSADLVLDDPDYDIVEYLYDWTVEGSSVRTVTSAALSDALPHHSGLNGDVVVCTVTPSDGADNGVAASDVVMLPEPSALMALGSGIAMLALLYRRRRYCNMQ
jgi:murein DD-endopeptidase MepM/ murein hydrolase activator NlpD